MFSIVFSAVRVAAATAAALLCVGLQAQDGLEARLAFLEQTLQRFYRGERLDDAIDRSNRAIEAHNAQARMLQAGIEREKPRLEELLAAGKALHARLEEMDKDLKNLPSGLDRSRKNQKVEARNALVRQINEQSAQAWQAVEAYNAFVKRTQETIEKGRLQALAIQEAVNARVTAFKAFTEAGQDTAFFTGLNRLLADVRQALRATPGDASLLGLLARVRGFRRELADWAIAGQARQPNGLVVVEALVEDEPCWLIVDTGAMDTIVSAEIVEAIGLGAKLGKQTTLSVIGGVRITGLAFRIPTLAVGGQALKDVPASAVRPFDVGIDGLLGQSFLKAFVYTIDERSPGKLVLTPR